MSTKRILISGTDKSLTYKPSLSLTLQSFQREKRKTINASIHLVDYSSITLFSPLIRNNDTR